jgi:hypothetical protein
VYKSVRKILITRGDTMSNYNIGQIRYSKGVEYLLNKINKKYSSEECEYEVDTYDLN